MCRNLVVDGLPEPPEPMPGDGDAGDTGTDTGEDTDTGTADTGEADTSTPDTNMPDTAEPDTNAPDTPAEDAAADSSSEDTTVGEDTATGGDGTMGGDEGGCACTTTSPRASGALWLLPLLFLARRRRRARSGAVVAVAGLLVACGGGDGGGGSPDGDDADVGAGDVAEDTGADTADTTVADTGPDDVAPDTAVADTGSDTADTAVADTASDTDAGQGDTDVGDTGAMDVVDATDASDVTDAADADADASVDLAAELLAALGDSSWHGVAMRTEGEAVRERAIELQFRSEDNEWAEIRNPYGPGRLRTMRFFRPQDDGATVDTTILSPSGWPVHPDNGLAEEWTFELVEGTPRQLRITDEGGTTTTYDEGPWPAPESGLTATIRVFPPGSIVDDAFCESGVSGFDYLTLFQFARDMSSVAATGTDVAAGVPLAAWDDPAGMNQFATTDVPGFDRYGGTALSDQFNFMVRYEGWLRHPGGDLAMREDDDSVEDAVWAFLGSDVGGTTEDEMFLEVHGFVWLDATPDEPSTTLAAGDVPIELILIRCDEAVGRTEVQMRIGGGDWQSAELAPLVPVVTAEDFPPVFE